MCCEAKRWKPFAEPIADPALYQRFPRPPDSFPEPSPEFSPESSPEPYWISLDSTPNAPIIFSGTFSGTFSRTLLNLTWLCIKSSWIFFPEAFADSCRILPGFILKLPGFFSGNFAEFCWTWSETFSESRWTWPGAELFWIEDPISLRCRK